MTTDSKTGTGIKIQVMAERLRLALNVASTIFNARRTPTLSIIQIMAKGDKAFLQYINMESAVIIDLQAKVVSEGTAMIPFCLLKQFTAEEKDDVAISVDNDQCLVQTDKTALLLPVVKDKYPVIPDDCETLCNVDKEFILNLSRAIPHSLQDDSKPVINTVYIHTDSHGEITNIVAVDGFRLFVCGLKIELPKNSKFIVPLKSCEALVKIFKKKGMSVGRGKKRLYFESDGIRFVTQLVEGNFPDYFRLAPSAFTWSFKTSAPLLAQRASQLNSKILRIEQEDQMLKLSMEIDKDFDAKLISLIPAEFTGDAIKYALNPYYLIDACKIFSEIKVEIKDAVQPCLVTGDLENIRVVIMPMLVQW